MTRHGHLGGFVLALALSCGQNGGSAPQAQGGVGTGGAVSAGATQGANGGASRGGVANGGASSGGVSLGGAAHGGVWPGGASSAGSFGGGPMSGGSASGGSANAGAGPGAGGASGVRVAGRQLIVDGQPFRLQGVCWNPVPKGKTHPSGLDFLGLAPTDVPLMAAAHVNAVRTYEPITDTKVLDLLWAAKIRVLNSVYPYGGDAASVVTARVNLVKNHPAILMWVIGNEWNYNGLYVDMTPAAAQARLNEVAALIHDADPSHPVATVYGELPAKVVVDAMPGIDLWGINAYRGISFGDLFSRWQKVSGKPMFLAEFGADAHNATRGAYDPTSQAEATEALIRELFAQASATVVDGATLGGTIFEWADEWWKDADGSPSGHEIGGVAPGGGPYPDQTFNEEWWGIVDIDRSPRPAYEVLSRIYGGG